MADRLGPEAVAPIEEFARQGRWDEFAASFFIRALEAPAAEIEALRQTPQWGPIVAHAEASRGDLRALASYDFQAARFSSLRIPTLLQIGAGSRRRLCVTDALAAALSSARVESLEGLNHEAMKTAPELYA